jgi:hypothetical protein
VRDGDLAWEPAHAWQERYLILAMELKSFSHCIRSMIFLVKQGIYVVAKFMFWLVTSTRESVDATARGAFLSLKLDEATTLIEKMASNQSWNEEHVQPYKRGGGMHQLKKVDMISAKLDLIMKKLEERDIEKKEVMHINDSRMTCEKYGDIGHLGNNCPTIQENVNYINNNNNYRPQPNQG